ncbi:MAG TPA: hypothetical protein ENN31_01625 [Candidatus Vogelbacteria bacterium]|nr:hypothetical protein [Candidatus Vogelbacteria bacterium]
MAIRIKLDVFKVNGKYYAIRVLLDLVQDVELSHLGLGEKVFSITGDVENSTFSAFEEKARQKARELGINHVINLDPFLT